MTRRRRARKDCEYDKKPSWRDEDAAIWGARKYYRAALRNGTHAEARYVYKCPHTHADEPDHYHLTSQSRGRQPVFLEDDHELPD